MIIQLKASKIKWITEQRKKQKQRPKTTKLNKIRRICKRIKEYVKG